MSENIIIAVIGSIGVVAAAVVGAYATHLQRLKRRQAENEMTLQRTALDFTGFLSEWSGVQEDIEQLLRDTEIDRFMILRAWNGKLTPKWTTAIYQVRRGKQTPIQYIHFELDGDYVERLREIDANGFLYFDVNSLPPSAIKQVYETEGVTGSAWFHLENLEFNKEGCKAVTYCSFATHEDTPISESTVTRCRILAGRLKGVAASLSQTETIIN